MNAQRNLTVLGAALLVATAVPAFASPPLVLDAQATANPDGTYAIAATVSHNDEGWKHYLDRWDVLDPSGKVLASRTLFHPHDSDKPFTRSLSRVEIPVGVTQITVRAHCNVDGDGPRMFTLSLPPRR